MIQRSKSHEFTQAVSGTAPSSLQLVPRVMLTGTWVLSAQEVVKISLGPCARMIPN